MLSSIVLTRPATTTWRSKRPAWCSLESCASLRIRAGGFFLRQKPGGLDGVYQQAHLRQLKGAAAQVIAEVVPLPDPDQVQPKFLQQLQVRVKRFALGGDLERIQIRLQCSDAGRVVLIRTAVKIVV